MWKVNSYFEKLERKNGSCGRGGRGVERILLFEFEKLEAHLNANERSQDGKGY